MTAPITTPTFADIYDRVIGPDFWEYWWPAFEQVCRDQDVTFDTVADVACGTGEIALKLAQSGRTVFATDLSDDMLRVARHKCAGAHVTLLQQDMTALSLPQPVDLLLCCYDALNMLADTDALAGCFAGFFRALVPGGHVICDLATLRHLEQDWGSNEFHAPVGEIDTIWHTVWNPQTATSTIHMTATVPYQEGGATDGSIVTCRVVERGYPKSVIDRCITDAGFVIREVRDMIPWTPGTDDGQRLFYLLQKPDMK